MGESQIASESFFLCKLYIIEQENEINCFVSMPQTISGRGRPARAARPVLCVVVLFHVCRYICIAYRFHLHCYQYSVCSLCIMVTSPTHLPPPPPPLVSLARLSYFLFYRTGEGRESGATRIGDR